MRRLRIQQRTKKPVLTVRRGVGETKNLVYVAVANKMIPYPIGKSPIVYIGTTSRGLLRILESAGARSESVLSQHGITKIHFFVLTCTARQKLKSWKILERALIGRFRELRGAIPCENAKLKKSADRSWAQFFEEKQLDKVLGSYRPARSRKRKKSSK